MIPDLSGRCLVVVGKLLTHPCARIAEQSCAECGRATCALHRAKKDPARCVECAGERALAESMQVSLVDMLAFEQADAAAFDGPLDVAREES